MRLICRWFTPVMIAAYFLALALVGVGIFAAAPTAGGVLPWSSALTVLGLPWNLMVDWLPE